MSRKKHRKTMRHGNGVNGKRRRNGEGTLERRGENGWLARWNVINAQGQKFRKSMMIYKSKEVPDIEAARKKLDALTVENGFNNLETALLKTQDQLLGVRSARSKFLDGLPALKVEDAFEVFSGTRAGRKPSDASRVMYECQFNRFVKWLRYEYPNIMEMRQVTRPIARAFSEYLLSRFSANTHNKYVTLLSAIWKSVMQKEVEEADGVDARANVTVLNEMPKARLSCNPWDGIEKEEAVVHSRRELTFEEVRRVCGFVEGEMRLLFCLGVETGFRLHDAVLLEWSRIDMERGFIKIRPHKVERKMSIKHEWVTMPILPELYAMLSETPSDRRMGYVVPELAQTYLHRPSLLSWKISNVFHACGIETNSERGKGRRCVDVGYHSLRHTFVSIASKYMPLTTVQVLCGHSSPAMTTHYLHISKETIKEQMQNFPRLLAPPENPQTV